MHFWSSKHVAPRCNVHTQIGMCPLTCTGKYNTQMFACKAKKSSPHIHASYVCSLWNIDAYRYTLYHGWTVLRAKKKKTRRVWEPWLGRDWEGEICRTGLLEPWAMSIESRESPYFDVGIYNSSHSHMWATVLRRARGTYCTWVLALYCPTSFLHVSNEQAKQGYSRDSRSLPAYFSVSASTQPGY